MGVDTTIFTSRPTAHTEHQHPHVSWGAIFCGVFIALAVELLFTLLGSAIGLSAFEPVRRETIERSTAIGAGIFTFVTMLISYYIGGYVASKLSGFSFRYTSVLHGLSTWALMSVTVTYILGSSAGAFFNDTLRMTKGGGVAQTIVSSLPGISEQQAGQVSKKVPTLNIPIFNKDDVTKTQAVKVTAGVTWTLFFTYLLGAFSSILGGLAGNPTYSSRYRPMPEASIERRAA